MTEGNFMKKLLVALLCAILVLTAAACGKEKKAPSFGKNKYLDVPALQQTDPAWNYHVPQGLATYLGGIGSGVFAVCNAIRFVTGEFVSPTELADSFAAGGALTDDGLLKYLTFSKDGALDEYLSAHDNIKVQLETEWNDEFIAASQMDKYLDSGMACIIHIEGHFMAVVAHDAETSRYLVLDSLVNNTRKTGISGTWLHENSFDEGMSCSADGFCVIKAKGTPAKHDDLIHVNNDNSEFCFIIRSNGEGEAYFKETGSTSFAGNPGDSVTLVVTPLYGTRMNQLIVGGTFMEIKNEGKSSEYSLVLPKGNCDVLVNFG